MATSCVRTFIHLGSREAAFVRALQRLMEKRSPTRGRPRMNKVINAILLDYKRVLEMASDPDFLDAYEYVKSKRRKQPIHVE